MDIIEVSDPSAEEATLCERMQREDRRVQLANKKFAAQDPADQRVTIAKDVLKWLELGKLIAKTGTYLVPIGTPAQRTKVNGNECAACALGAVFACTAERVGGFLGFWGQGQYDMHNKLSRYFDRQQLKLIEAAFECKSGYACDDYGNNTDEDDRAVVLGWKNPPPTRSDHEDDASYNRSRLEADRARMTAIMKNIIANDGDFVP